MINSTTLLKAYTTWVFTNVGVVRSVRGGRLLLGGPLWPCVRLAPLWRYGASNVGRTDVDTKRKMEEGKEKEEGEGKGKGNGKGKDKRGRGKVSERERGRDKWRRKGKGKGRKRGREGVWEGKGKAKRKGKERGRKQGKGNENRGKERGRWKEDSLRKVGSMDARTHARTLRWFYTLSNAMHCIGLTASSLYVNGNDATQCRHGGAQMSCSANALMSDTIWGSCAVVPVVCLPCMWLQCLWQQQWCWWSQWGCVELAMPLLSLMWYILESVQQSYDLSDRLIRAISHWQLSDHGDDDVLRLLEQGADVNKLHGTLLPLHCACMTGDAVVVAMLLKHGAEVSASRYSCCWFCFSF